MTALEELVVRLPFAVVGVDRRLRVAFANERAATMLGSRPGARLPSELDALAERLTRVAKPLDPIEVELADGRFLEVSGLDAAGDDPAVLFLADITAHRRQDRVMHEFLRNAAHQLRTPLAGITAAIEMLQSGAKERPADRDRFLAHVETHAHRLARLSHGLLVLARAQAGEEVPVDVVELSPVLQEIADVARPHDGVVMRAECPRGLAAVAAPDLLHEVLHGLVDNAVQYTRTGEIRIEAEQADGRVSVRVADSGPGIAADVLDRIFEPFFRLGAEGEGYGLGLAIASDAVRAMHGDIVVSSTPGKGTTFVVTLPSATVAR